jgi:hypothetical protein
MIEDVNGVDMVFSSQKCLISRVLIILVSKKPWLNARSALILVQQDLLVLKHWFSILARRPRDLERRSRKDHIEIHFFAAKKAFP